MMAKIRFDRDWLFYRGELPPYSDTDMWGGAKAKGFMFGAASMGFDDSSWRKVELPHDYVMEGDYTRNRSESRMMRSIPEMESIDSRHFAGGSLSGGIGWYRKTFAVNGERARGRVYIHFDGVYRDSTVFLNEYIVGRHSSGYTGFCYDITDFIDFERENVIAVRVDSSGREGWWYEGGGIYRHVWLEYKENIHIAADGVYLYEDISDDMKKAVIHAETEIINRETTDQKVTVRTTVYAANGSAACSGEREISIGQWDREICCQEIELENVHLWDVDDPYLYTVKTEIIKDGEVTDTEINNIGIRKCFFNAEYGFFLNGRNLKIKGVCCHHDHAGVGIGVPDSVWEYRIDQIKSIGANGYRSAHYPMSKEMLDICDRKGIKYFL